MKIDAHQHFWQVERGEYGWLTPELGVLYRDYGPEDLTPLLKRCAIDGTVLVQAAPTLAETEFLIGLAEKNSFIKGVVGWVDFESPNAVKDIERLAKSPHLVGLRPMIQDIEDTDWMLKPQLNPAFEALIAADLTFDALVFPRHLSNLQTLLAGYPSMRVVIDHGAKPQIASKQFDVWAADMSALAKNTGAFCKLSGLITEAASDWQPIDLKPYMDHLISSFGADRLIWGSDWPVLNLTSNYAQWHQLVEKRLSRENAVERVMGQNAQRAYKLKVVED